MATIKVTKEKCERCLYGYPCEMWEELSLPMEGEVCNNFEDKTELDFMKSVVSYTSVEQSRKLAEICVGTSKMI